MLCCAICILFFFRQKTAYDVRISDWSSDVCSSDLQEPAVDERAAASGLSESRVHVRGSLEPFDRASVLGSAAVFVATSERSDWPWRVIEALTVGTPIAEIGRASCRERVCQYVWISVVAVSLTTKT